MVVSAGVLVYRLCSVEAEFLVAHPGGPFYRRRREGVWTIPKGLVEVDETPLDAARREFEEETGLPCPQALTGLGEVRLKGGKRILAFAGEADLPVDQLRSNGFEMEWPRHSGKLATFPEIDEIRYVEADEARRLLHPAQAPLVERLLAHLRGPEGLSSGGA